MDKTVSQPGWKKTLREEREWQVLALTDRDCWVIAGVSSAVLDCVDTVVFLDVPRKISFWRVSKRNWKYLFRSRPELPPHCPELLIIPALCQIIWNFPGRIRPGILDQLGRSADRLSQFPLKTKNDMTDFLAALEEARDVGLTLRMAGKLMTSGVPAS